MSYRRGDKLWSEYRGPSAKALAALNRGRGQMLAIADAMVDLDERLAELEAAEAARARAERKAKRRK